MIKQCPFCKKIFKRNGKRIRFCSKSCSRQGHFSRSWIGKKHTQETKDKISKANLGVKFTEEHKNNIKKAWFKRHENSNRHP